MLTGPAGYVLLITLIKPHWAPALPPEARTIRGRRQQRPAFAARVVRGLHDRRRRVQPPRPEGTPTDENIVISMSVGVGLALRSRWPTACCVWACCPSMAERITFVLIPPLALIFLVLGTIFLGIATPTEGGAMGAVGALVMAPCACVRALAAQASGDGHDDEAVLLRGLHPGRFDGLQPTFQGWTARAGWNICCPACPADSWLLDRGEHPDLPAGLLPGLFELSFIVVPLLAPVADKLGIDLVWFGVLLAVNMQTSFMHPPFGFALFYLRSVAPTQDYKDRVTGRQVEQVTTGQIYWGAVPFVCIQIIMIGLVIGFPGMVSRRAGSQGRGRHQQRHPGITTARRAQKDVDMNQLFGLPEAASAASK